MRVIGPILLILLTGAGAWWLSSTYGDPASALHQAILIAASPILSMVSAFFMAGLRRHDELRKVRLDPDCLESLQRMLTRRGRRIYGRLYLGIFGGIFATVCASMLRSDPTKQALGAAYAGLAVVVVAFLYSSLENLYLTAQLRLLEESATKRKQRHAFIAETTA